MTFSTPSDLLRFLIGDDAPVVALGIPAEATREGRKRWGPSRLQPAEVTQVVAQHIAGVIAPREAFSEGGKSWREDRARWLGAYVLRRDEDGKPYCRWIVLDTDVKTGDHARGLTQEEATALALALYDVAAEAGLRPFLERSHSGKGWHLWILFDRDVGGAFAHWLAGSIAGAAAEVAGLDGPPEAFPKQADPPTLGNLVALPFTGSPRGEDGGLLFDRDGSPLDVSTIALSDPSPWLARFAEYDHLRLLAERRDVERRMQWRNAPDHAGSFDSDSVTCEDVARALAPHRITGETMREILIDCPRHASTSHRSLGVARDGTGWWCFACATGGGSYSLARWLLPDGTCHRDITEALRFASGVRA